MRIAGGAQTQRPAGNVKVAGFGAMMGIKCRPGQGKCV